MKRILFLLLIMATQLLSSSYAQSSALTNQLDQAAEQVIAVETERYRYEQALAYDAERPWLTSITTSKVNLKNERSETETFFLSLADIDPKLISIETSRDEQYVLLRTRKRQDYIQVSDDDGDVDYVSEVKLWSAEIDLAKALKTSLIEAATEALPLWEAGFAPGTTLPALNQWLAESIAPVETAKETLRLNWKSDPQLLDHVNLQMLSSEEEGEKVYLFSHADLARNSPKLNTRKGTVSVTLSTVNRKDLIRVELDGKLSAYENSVEVPLASIEAAKKFMLVMETISPLAREAREKRLYKPTSLNDALTQFTTLLNTESTSEDEVVTTVFSSAPGMRLTVSTEDIEREESERITYVFDFEDLAANKAEISVKGTRLSVKVPTLKGRDFIQSIIEEEEEQKIDFMDELVFPVDRVEVAHQLMSLLPYLVEESSKVTIPTIGFQEIRQIIRGSSTKNVTQTLTSEKPCAWIFNSIEEGRNTDESSYEFNLYDLNPDKISLEVKRSELYINISTIRGEEIINVYENSEPAFTDEMDWRISNLAEAKQVRSSLIALVKGCKIK